MKKSCCNNDMKYFEKPNAGLCDICHPAENKVSPIEAVAMCPPMGEPKLLTMMAPVVFDECGINLCRTVCIEDLQDVCNGEARTQCDILFGGLSKCDLLNACKIQLQVVDIDFNFVDPMGNRFSEIQPAKCKPNLSRITLRDIDVTFAVSIIDSCCNVSKQGMMTLRYLGDERDCAYDSCTNPSCISFDLYTPYGTSYAAENSGGCNKLVPTINFMGYINSEKGRSGYQNGLDGFFEFPVDNTIQQGIGAQALAKVVASDCNRLAIGLTLYIKSIYFVQYKFRHEGLTVPPKLTPVEEEENNNCLDFVCGDLLEASIRPLEVGENAKSINNSCRSYVNNDTNKNCCSCNKCSCNKCGCGTSN